MEPLEAKRLLSKYLFACNPVGQPRHITMVAVGPKLRNGRPTGEMAIIIGVAKKLPPQMLQSSSSFEANMRLWRSLMPLQANAHLVMIPPEIAGIKTDVQEKPIYQHFSSSVCGVLAEVQAAITELQAAYGCSSNGNGSSIQNRQKFRPTIPAGASTILHGSTACTLTGWVIDKATGLYRAIVAHHCGEDFTNCTPAPAGSVWVQPSPMDGGSDADHWATRGTEEVDMKDAHVDAFVLDPEDQAMFTNEIVGLGTIDGKALDPQQGEMASMSGRTSGVIQGVITSPSADVSINYEGCGILTKEDTVITQLPAQGGDSGSPCVLTRDGKQLIFGQLIAGGSGEGVAFKIQYIEEGYKCDFDISQAPPSPPTPPNPPSPTEEVQYSVDDGLTWQTAESIIVKPVPAS
jgi:hypothetical protein